MGGLGVKGAAERTWHLAGALLSVLSQHLLSSGQDSVCSVTNICLVSFPPPQAETTSPASPESPGATANGQGHLAGNLLSSPSFPCDPQWGEAGTHL